MKNLLLWVILASGLIADIAVAQSKVTQPKVAQPKVAQPIHEHGSKAADSGSTNRIDIARNEETKLKLINPEPFLAELRTRRLEVEAKFNSKEIAAGELTEQLASLRQDFMEIGARDDAVSVAMRVGDFPEAAPRARALAWFDLAKLVSRNPGVEPAKVFANAAEAYDLAVECMSEIPPSERKQRDYEIEGSARSWLAFSCDIAGEKDRAMQERLKILTDKELCANTYPEVVIGIYQKFTNYYEELGNYDDAEAMRAAGARYLVDRAADFTPEQKLTVGLSLVANARSVPKEFRLKLLEELWNEPALEENLLILRVGNDLGLFYFFDSKSAAKREPFFKEMHSRCVKMLQPKKFPNGESNSMYADLKRIESQALVLALESNSVPNSKKEWRERLQANFKQFGRSVNVPENHPYATEANLKTIADIVSRYFFELVPQPNNKKI